MPERVVGVVYGRGNLVFSYDSLRPVVGTAQCRKCFRTWHLEGKAQGWVLAAAEQHSATCGGKGPERALCCHDPPGPAEELGPDGRLHVFDCGVMMVKPGPCDGIRPEAVDGRAKISEGRYA